MERQQLFEQLGTTHEAMKVRAMMQSAQLTSG